MVWAPENMSWVLYGQITANDNAGEGQHLHPLDAAPQQRPRRRLHRGAGGIDIIDQHHATPLEPARQVRMRREGALHIAQASIAREPDLLARVPAPLHQMRIDRQFQLPPQFLRQQQRLVVTPQPQAAGMERHRDEKRRGFPEFPPSRRHQPGTEPGQLRPVAIFEPADHDIGDRAIGHRRPRPQEGRRRGQRFARQRPCAQIAREWQAQHRAERRRYHPHLRKAGRTQHITLDERRAAAGAGRRIKLVERQLADPAQAMAQPPQPGRNFDLPAPALHNIHIATPRPLGQPPLESLPKLSQPPSLFDTALVARHLARRESTDNFVRDLVFADLADRLGAHMRDFSRALLIAPDAATLPQTLATGAGPIHFTRIEAFADEAEFPLFAEQEYDLIVSLLHLQAVNDIPGHLARLRARLKPDGLLMAALIGGESLTELREAFLSTDLALSGGASARVAPMVQVRDAGALLQRAGFALPVADVETHVVRYAHPLALMAELKALGAANPLTDRPRRPATRTLLAAAAAAYAERDQDPDGRVRATLEIVWLAGWVPHESQQKPLRPGSAKISMKDVLGRGERDDGDKS